MLNKEQMFIVHEFIDKNATKNVWNVSDELIKMVFEVVDAQDSNQIKLLDEKLKALQAIPAWSWLLSTKICITSTVFPI